MSDAAHASRCDESVTVVLSAEQARTIREILFRDLEEWAEALAEQARDAYTELGAKGAMAGEDARGTQHTILDKTVSLLDAIGWSSWGEH